MVSTFTPNVQIEQPARGDDVGTWDTPVNNNMSLIDLIVGGTVTIPLNNANVTLSPAQFKCKQIIFSSTLTANVTILFPSSFTKSYELYNTCSGTSAFVVQAGSVGGGQAVGLPPGEIMSVVSDGTNIRFSNLGRIGSYMDIATTTVPNWLGFCTVPPYLNCNGTTFSSATYPQLTVILGGTTLPDSRGETRVTLDQGVGRIGGQIAGTVVGALGGAESVVLSAAQMPVHNHGYSDPGHTHGYIAPALQVTNYAAGSNAAATPSQSAANTNSATIGITISNAGGGTAHNNLQPSYIGGLTFIRAG